LRRKGERRAGKREDERWGGKKRRKKRGLEMKKGYGKGRRVIRKVDEAIHLSMAPPYIPDPQLETC